MSTNRIKSSHRKKSQRPPKPYLTFPLTVHPSGRWCKRIRNRLHYFGYWRNANGSLKSDGGDWQTALELYKSQADDLHAGRISRTCRNRPLISKTVCSIIRVLRPASSYACHCGRKRSELCGERLSGDRSRKTKTMPTVFSSQNTVNAGFA